MAHPINDKLNKAEGREPVTCNDTCRYWAYPHMSKACILSDVFSVRKGEPCYEYQDKGNDKEGR